MPTKKIAVIGGGTMGSGIALTAAIHEMHAVVVDISESQLERAKTYHEKQCARSVSKERMTQTESDAALGRISYVSSMSEASDAQWSVEAATENIDVKKKIFSQAFLNFRSHVRVHDEG